jgi:SAM-dependent methyltransferase
MGELPKLVKHTDPKCCKFHGVDFSPVAVAAYIEQGHTATECYAELLPFNDDKWDTVVCTETLEHTENPRAVLDELRRVCAGQIFITVPPEVQGRRCTQHKWKISADEWAELLDLPPHTWTGTAQIGWEIDAS